MKGSKYSILSMLSSIICFAGLLIHDYNLSLIYLSSDGKTRALFGIIELTRLHIKLYFIPFALLSIVFAVLAVKKKEKKGRVVVSMVCCLIAIISFFVRYWRFMI